MTDQLSLAFMAPRSIGLANKEQRELMSRCWFSLANQKRTASIEHRFGENYVKISGTDDYGIATVHDSAVLQFATSHYIAALNRGEEISRRFRFTAYDFWSWQNKKKLGGNAYSHLWSSLLRLQNTNVETNIRVAEGVETRRFHMLSEIKQTVGIGGRHHGYEVIFPEFFYENIQNMTSILTLDARYFSLTSSIDRFLYLYVRQASGGRATEWVEDIESIYKKSGSLSGLKHFRKHIKRLWDRGGTLLDYTIGYQVSERKKRQLTMQKTSTVQHG